MVVHALEIGDAVLVAARVMGHLDVSLGQRGLLLEVEGGVEVVRRLLLVPGARVVHRDSMLPVDRVPHVDARALLDWEHAGPTGVYNCRFVASPGADGAIISALHPYLAAAELTDLSQANQAVIDFVVLAVNERLERMRAAAEPVR